MRRIVGLMMLPIVLAAPCLDAQQDAPVALDSARFEALQLLQGIPSTPFLDSLEVERLARGILDIRNSIPEVRAIFEFRDQSYLLLFLSEAAQVQLDTLPFEPDSVVRVRTVKWLEIESIDSLNQLFEVDSIEVAYSFSGRRVRWLRPHFSGIPNVPVLARAYRSVPEVDFAGPELYVDGDGIVHFRKKGLWYFVFTRGTGDCPAGCIHRDFYYVTHDPGSGVSELVDTLLDGQFDVSRVHLWDIPSRLHLDPYRDYEDLTSQIGDDRWWVRYHVVAVLDYLVRDPEHPLGGEQDRDHFTRMKRAVQDHWTEVLLLLSDCVADEDDEVRAVARRALIHVSGEDYGEGEDARERWRRWVRTGEGQILEEDEGTARREGESHVCSRPNCV